MMNNHFVMSQNYGIHPIANTSKKFRTRYYYILKHFVDQCGSNDLPISAKMNKYKTEFIGEEIKLHKSGNVDKAIMSIVNNSFKPWRDKYRYFLLCDLAFILASHSAVQNALDRLKKYLSTKQCVLMDALFKSIFDEQYPDARIACMAPLLDQVWKNINFIKRPMRKIFITANMSAGKSTLINAIVGKHITRTSLEACTAKLHYIYNMPIEDSAIHMIASPINLNATDADLFKQHESEKIHIASYFRTADQYSSRICLIDTPGVNSSMHIEHAEMTRKALVKENYNVLVYVFNANKLGTDDELCYLKYISENVPKEKTVFVVNKMDNFKSADDSIEASMAGIKNDLLKLGYTDPTVCPISAYFAYLLQMKQSNARMSEDEQDLFGLYSKKFSKSEYDLSRYYPQADGGTSSKNDKLAILGKRCGFHGLETILMGK